MASIFGHALAGYTIGSIYPAKGKRWKFWILAVLCTILPDADVIGFAWGIPYEHPFGHRGITHSIFFAVIVGLIIKSIFYKSSAWLSASGIGVVFIFSILTISHALLDAMTSGGLGVALYAPFDNTRIFFPWRPIQVSPIGASAFFSEWGIRVLLSEAVWIGIPAVCILLARKSLRKYRRKQ